MNPTLTMGKVLKYLQEHNLEIISTPTGFIVRVKDNGDLIANERLDFQELIEWLGERIHPCLGIKNVPEW